MYKWHSLWIGRPHMWRVHGCWAVWKAGHGSAVPSVLLMRWRREHAILSRVGVWLVVNELHRLMRHGVWSFHLSTPRVREDYDTFKVVTGVDAQATLDGCWGVANLLMPSRFEDKEISPRSEMGLG